MQCIVLYAASMCSYPSEMSSETNIFNFELTVFTWARMWGSMVIFRSQEVSVSKRVAKHCTRVFKCAHRYKSKGMGQTIMGAVPREQLADAVTPYRYELSSLFWCRELGSEIYPSVLYTVCLVCVCVCVYKQLYQPYQIKILSFYFYQQFFKAAAPCTAYSVSTCGGIWWVS
jgi:hypothetical protein